MTEAEASVVLARIESFNARLDTLFDQQSAIITKIDALPQKQSKLLLITLVISVLGNVGLAAYLMGALL